MSRELSPLTRSEDDRRQLIVWAVACAERALPLFEETSLGDHRPREAFGRRHATVGPQGEAIAQTRVWVLPNPSGLNAHWSADSLAREFARLRAAMPD